jgi:Family of unknown function (DUF5719)
MSPAHHRGSPRWPALLLVVAVLAGVAVATRTPGTGPVGGPPPVPAATVAASDAESSAWYCTGQTTGTGAPGSVVLTNTGTRAVSGTIAAVTDTGATVDTKIAVPARDQLVTSVPAPKSGTWLSQAITLSGGGVAVTQTVHGSSGWSEAPCQSSTSAQWYFPDGLTTGANDLFISLFNPTSTPDVIDLSFVTPGGVTHPIGFQGIVLKAGQTQVENIGSFVQNQPRVSTSVTTRTGRVVASELQVFAGNGSGLAVVPGAPRTERQWTIPQSEEQAGGSSAIDVFNPGPNTEDVTVRATLASGPLAPFAARVSPHSTWVLPTSAETRIPKGDTYSTIIDATGGPGVVVGRMVTSAPTTPSPQAGAADAIDDLSASSPIGTWVVPSPGSVANPLVPGASPDQLALTDTSGRREHYVVSVLTDGRTRNIASGTVQASSSVSLGTTLLSPAGLNPLLVHASGPMAVSEDVGSTGGIGVVTLPGIRLTGTTGS